MILRGLDSIVAELALESFSRSRRNSSFPGILPRSSSRASMMILSPQLRPHDVRPRRSSHLMIPSPGHQLGVSPRGRRASCVSRFDRGPAQARHSPTPSPLSGILRRHQSQIVSELSCQTFNTIILEDDSVV